MARKTRRLPVLELGAEYLAMGYLMRRNILAYKAPERNEGYDILCTHPDPKRAKRTVRIQVKSRYQIDADRKVFVKRTSLDRFDYLIAVFFNIGYFFGYKPRPSYPTETEIYTLPKGVVRAKLEKAHSGLDRLFIPAEGMDHYKNQRGIERVAKALGIEDPRMSA